LEITHTNCYASADPNAMTLRLTLAIPELRIIGNYQSDGRILLLEVKGTGTFWTVLRNVVVTSDSNLVLSGSGPNAVLQVSSQTLDLTVERIRMQLNNLFQGDATLGQSVNSFLNDNSQSVFSELKPELSRQVGELVVKVMNDALSALPAEKFLIKA